MFEHRDYGMTSGFTKFSLKTRCVCHKVNSQILEQTENVNKNLDEKVPGGKGKKTSS